MSKNVGYWISISLVLIGALNWGIVGLFSYNFVENLTGIATFLTRAIYTGIGIAAVYSIYNMIMR